MVYSGAKSKLSNGTTTVVPVPLVQPLPEVKGPLSLPGKEVLSLLIKKELLATNLLLDCGLEAGLSAVAVEKFADSEVVMCINDIMSLQAFPGIPDVESSCCRGRRCCRWKLYSFVSSADAPTRC